MSITARAYAKVNLTLEILGRRSDGYHEIVSIMQTISLCDTLLLEDAAGITVQCSDPALNGPENIVHRAARLLQQEAGGERGALITINKGIPAAAGLGGGSTDAAATLAALNRLWGLCLPPERLLALASQLGSDVPFFLRGGTALVSGRGEQVEQLPALTDTWMLLVHPAIQIERKTETLYAMITSEHWTKGYATEELAGRIRRGRRLREALLYNGFDAVVPSLLPDVSCWRRLMLEEAPARPHVVGSGPSLFIPLESPEQGRRIAARLVEAGECSRPGAAGVFVVRTEPRGHELTESRP